MDYVKVALPTLITGMETDELATIYPIDVNDLEAFNRSLGRSYQVKVGFLPEDKVFTIARGGVKEAIPIDVDGLVSEEGKLDLQVIKFLGAVCLADKKTIKFMMGEMDGSKQKKMFLLQGKSYKDTLMLVPGGVVGKTEERYYPVWWTGFYNIMSAIREYQRNDLITGVIGLL